MNDPFDDAIGAIAAGAAEFQKLLANDSHDATYKDPNEPFSIVPPGAFCLKLAYDVWRDMYNARQFVAGAVAHHPSVFDAGKIKLATEHERPNAANLLRALQGFTPDEVDEVARLFREDYEGNNPEVGA